MKVRGFISNIRRMHESGLMTLGLTVFILLFLLSESAQAKSVNCPPTQEQIDRAKKKKVNDEVVYKEENIAGQDTKDKRLEVQKDKQGNVVELWCIDSDTTNGFFGKRYIPADKTKKTVWVGKCAFPAGKNNQVKCPPPEKGKPSVWEKLSWTNSTTDGKKDWHYNYDVANNKLKIWKTKSHLEKGKGEDGKEYEWPVVDEKIDPPWYDGLGIEDWDKLPKLSDYPVPLEPGAGWAGPQFDVIPEQTGPTWQYGLYVPTLGGSGTVDDPFFGFSLEIDLGDVWSISGVGIHDPFVTGDSALPEWGAWTIYDWGSDFVTYQATQAVMLTPGFVISGLGFHSEAPAGQVSWVGYGTGMNYDSYTTGPVPAPGALILANVGVGLVGWLRRRRTL